MDNDLFSFIVFKKLLSKNMALTNILLSFERTWLTTACFWATFSRLDCFLPFYYFMQSRLNRLVSVIRKQFSTYFRCQILQLSLLNFSFDWILYRQLRFTLNYVNLQIAIALNFYLKLDLPSRRVCAQLKVWLLVTSTNTSKTAKEDRLLIT